MDGSIDLAKAFLASGTNRVVATPHVNERWGVRLEEARESFDALVSQLKVESIGLRVEFGAEIALTTAVDLDDDLLKSFRLGNGGWLLIEPPASAPSTSVHAMMYEIQSHGHRVLLAHPERCQAFQRDLDLLAWLVKGGVRTQVTAAALTGGFGRTAQTTVMAMFEQGLVHALASDAHDAEARPPGLEGHLRRAGYGYLYEWLCSAMPAMILEGGSEPPRTQVKVPTFRWKRLFRS